MNTKRRDTSLSAGKTGLRKFVWFYCSEHDLDSVFYALFIT